MISVLPNRPGPQKGWGHMCAWYVRLLGEVAVGPDPTSVVPVRGRTPRAVVAHLALAPGNVLSTGSLVDQIWDDPPVSARNAIQVAVSGLRKEFGPGFVLSSTTGYRLPLDAVRIDLAEAGAQLSAAERLLHDGQLHEAAERVTGTLSLFIGEALSGLDGQAVTVARRRSADLRHRARLLQARCFSLAGDPLPAIDVLREAIAAEPLDEAARIDLMRALAAVGRRGEAVRVFEALRLQLRDELGIAPSATVLDVVDELAKPARAR